MSQYLDRVRDLLNDAEGHAQRGEWEAVRALAGAALALAPDAPEARRLLVEAEQAAPVPGERRQLTVMFCDVVGSTALTATKDPEVVREVLRSYQSACDEVVRHFEGHIANYVGDGIVAYFGHPVPHEDDPRRAVRAGLDLLDALRPVTGEALRRYGIDLSVRVAVHTGMVVRADMGSAASPDRHAVVGDTPNLAARLQDLAAPGTLVVSADTFDLVRDWFLAAPLGLQPVKGFTDPVEVFEVIGELPPGARIQTQADLTPHVGRATELTRLDETWSEVLDGAARSVLITGEAGVGKSRLADVARRRTEGSGGFGLTAVCSSYQTDRPIYPVRRLLEQIAGIEAGDDPKQALSRLWAAMDAVGLGDSLPCIASLLGFEPQPWCPAPELDGVRLREEILSTLVAWVRASATEQPFLLVVDDLQWADPSSIELIGRLVAAGIPGLMLVLTARSPFAAPWRVTHHLELSRLSRDDLGELADRLPGGRVLDPAHLDALIERSDGVPLFLEELVRAAVAGHEASGAVDLDTIPPALRDLLLARLAGAGVELRLAQIIATIGNEVPLDLARTVSRLPGDQFDRQLKALLDTELLVVDDADRPRVRFRHHLLGELAYDTQLQAARTRVHAAVADALSARGTEEPSDFGALAHHLERAGRFEGAVEALAELAERAYGQGAFVEATAVLERAFGLLDHVAGVRRSELEFEVRLLRGMVAAATLGYAAPQAVVDFDRCGELVASLQSTGYLDDGDNADRAWSVLGLVATYLLQGRLDECEQVQRNIGGQLRPGGNLRRYVVGHQGMVDFFRGDYPAASDHLWTARRVASEMDIPYRMPLPNDIEVVALTHRGFGLAMQGRVAEARSTFDDARTRADRLPFPRGPFSFCYLAGVESACERVVGQVDRSAEIASDLMTVAERHGFTFWLLLGSLNRALFELLEGDESASERIAAMTGMLHAMQIRVWLPLFSSSTADGHLHHGRAAVAEPFVVEGLQVADETGAHFWTSALLRQQGECRLALDDPAEGLALVDRSVELAVRQGARLHELQGRRILVEHRTDDVDVEALEALVIDLDAIEGSELPDLEAARALLATHR